MSLSEVITEIKNCRGEDGSDLNVITTQIDAISRQLLLQSIASSEESKEVRTRLIQLIEEAFVCGDYNPDMIIDTSSSETLLMRICKNEKRDISLLCELCTLLLDVGANINAVNRDKKSAIDLAMENQCYPLAQLLSNRGAILNSIEQHDLLWDYLYDYNWGTRFYCHNRFIEALLVTKAFADAKVPTKRHQGRIVERTQTLLQNDTIDNLKHELTAYNYYRLIHDTESSDQQDEYDEISEMHDTPVRRHDCKESIKVVIECEECIVTERYFPIDTPIQVFFVTLMMYRLLTVWSFRTYSFSYRVKQVMRSI